VTRAIAIVIALGACVVPAGSGFAPRRAATTSPAPSAPVPVAAPSPGRPAPIASPEPPPSSQPAPAEPAPPRTASGDLNGGMIIRSQIDQLEGLPVEEAKAKLAAWGFVGKLYVEEGVYLASCGKGTVCRIQPGSGFSTHADVIFTVNPKLEISTPP
jgi:hypothetical protein